MYHKVFYCNKSVRIIRNINNIQQIKLSNRKIRIFDYRKCRQSIVISNGLDWPLNTIEITQNLEGYFLPQSSTNKVT